MNKDEYDPSNMSFELSEARIRKLWDNRQVIKRCIIEVFDK